MEAEELLEKARRIATVAHEGQVDKAAKPYIAHPLRVAAAVEGADAKMVALLHDTVEDSDVTLAELETHGFPVHVVAAIDAVTRRPNEDKASYYERVMRDRLALTVKIADMTDNLDPTRLPNPTAHDKKRSARYRAVLPQLIAALRTFDEQ